MRFLGQVVKAHRRVLVIQNEMRERVREKVLKNVESCAGTLKEETKNIIYSELDLEVVNIPKKHKLDWSFLGV